MDLFGFDREAAMDESSTKLIAGSTQRLLADRLRQRYASCRESLANRAGPSPAQAECMVATPCPGVTKAAVQEEPGSSSSPGPTERFSTLFSQAYSAARDSQENALAVILDRGRQHLAA